MAFPYSTPFYFHLPLHFEYFPLQPPPLTLFSPLSVFAPIPLTCIFAGTRRVSSPPRVPIEAKTSVMRSNAFVPSEPVAGGDHVLPSVMQGCEESTLGLAMGLGSMATRALTVGRSMSQVPLSRRCRSANPSATSWFPGWSSRSLTALAQVRISRR